MFPCSSILGLGLLRKSNTKKIRKEKITPSFSVSFNKLMLYGKRAEGTTAYWDTA